MSKFKVGDRVRMIKNDHDYEDVPLGTIVTVTDVSPGKDIFCIINDRYFPDYRFELVENEMVEPHPVEIEMAHVINKIFDNYCFIKNNNQVLYDTNVVLAMLRDLADSMGVKFSDVTHVVTT